MFSDIIGIDNLKSIDLHGEVSDIANVLVKDFICDCFKSKEKYCVVIHGKGANIIRNVVNDVLKYSEYVEDYKLYYYNDGCTIVKLKQENICS